MKRSVVGWLGTPKLCVGGWLLVGILAGCVSEVASSDAVAPSRRFTQVSLFSTLLCGRYGGVADLKWVKVRGNLAIATMDRLDGEVMMVDGVVYQVRSDGSVRKPSDETGFFSVGVRETGD